MNRVMKFAKNTLRLLQNKDLSDLDLAWPNNREVRLKQRFNSIPYYANQACRARRDGGDEAERKYWNDLYQIYLTSTQGHSGSDFIIKTRQNKEVNRRK